MPEYQCLWFQFYRASNFYCMAIAAEPSSPTGPPLATDWVAVSVAAVLEMGVTTAAIVASAAVAICHASTEFLSPSGRRTIRTRGTRGTRGAQQEAASWQEVEAPVNRRHRHDKRRRDNQPDKRHKRGHWRQKQQQLQLCNNQQKRNGMKTRSSSHREVAARRLTWWRWLHDCRGGSNDNYNSEKTTMMTTTAAASVGSNVGMDAAAPLRQWLTTRGKHSQHQR